MTVRCPPVRGLASKRSTARLAASSTSIVEAFEDAVVAQGSDAEAGLLDVGAFSGLCGDAADDVDAFLLDIGAVGVAKRDFLGAVAVDDVGADDAGLAPDDLVVVIGEFGFFLESDLAGVFDDDGIDDIDMRFDLREHSRFAFVAGR